MFTAFQKLSLQQDSESFSFNMRTLKLILTLCFVTMMIGSSDSMLMYYRRLRPSEPMDYDDEKVKIITCTSFRICTILIIGTGNQISWANGRTSFALFGLLAYE